MEDMIMSVVLPGTLHGCHVPGVRHHADGGAVPFGRGADGAQPSGSKVLTHRTAGYTALGVQNGVGKLPGLFLRQAQHEESQPLCGFAANARQTGELLHQLFQRGGKVFIFCCSFALFACCKQQNENHVHRFPRRCFRPCRAIRLLYAAKILPAALAEVCR